jgi:beta-lactamase class A
MNRPTFALGLLAAPFAINRRGGFTEIERGHSCRIGVFAHDLQSGRSVAYNADDPFLMCSTFKLALAMLVLTRVDRGQEQLSGMLPFTAHDIITYSPALEPYPNGGALSIEALLASMIDKSDNGAANLLLRAAGGPPAVTRFVRALGIAPFRLDRNEPGVNLPAPGDLRDTASPRAMVTLATRLVRDTVLAPASNARLIGWLRGSTTGKARVRSVTPASFIVGDKTGTGDYNANDLAILWRRDGGSPIVIGVYVAQLTARSPFNPIVAAAAASALRQLGVEGAQAS